MPRKSEWRDGFSCCVVETLRSKTYRGNQLKKDRGVGGGSRRIRETKRGVLWANNKGTQTWTWQGSERSAMSLVVRCP
jgi:hypothetical protein